MLAFPGASSKQMLHYLDINLENCNTDTVIIHVGVNDLMHDNSQSNIESLIRNIKAPITPIDAQTKFRNTARVLFPLLFFLSVSFISFSACQLLSAHGAW